MVFAYHASACLSQPRALDLGFSDGSAARIKIAQHLSRRRPMGETNGVAEATDVAEEVE